MWISISIVHSEYQNCFLGYLGGSVSPTLDLSSGHDLTVHEIEPHVGLCADRGEPAWDSLSLCSPYLCSLSLSL